MDTARVTIIMEEKNGLHVQSIDSSIMVDISRMGLDNYSISYGFDFGIKNMMNMGFSFDYMGDEKLIIDSILKNDDLNKLLGIDHDCLDTHYEYLINPKLILIFLEMNKENNLSIVNFHIMEDNRRHPFLIENVTVINGLEQNRTNKKELPTEELPIMKSHITYGIIKKLYDKSEDFISNSPSAYTKEDQLTNLVKLKVNKMIRFISTFKSNLDDGIQIIVHSDDKNMHDLIDIYSSLNSDLNSVYHRGEFLELSSDNLDSINEILKIGIKLFTSLSELYNPAELIDMVICPNCGQDTPHTGDEVVCINCDAKLICERLMDDVVGIGNHKYVALIISSEKDEDHDDLYPGEVRTDECGECTSGCDGECGCDH